MKNRNRDINFDMSTEYSEDYGRCTFTDLIYNIIDESDPDDVLELNSYNDKFKNNDKSGILDKLIRLDNFDAEKIAGDDNKERFDMLKLLKALYMIEKNGMTKKELKKGKDMSTAKVRITDILAHPSMENIYTYYTDKNVYGKVFDNLEKTVSIAVKDSVFRAEKYDQINYDWDCLINKLFDYVYSDKAIMAHENACLDLDRIYEYFSQILLKKLSEREPVNISENEGVLTTFFNILQSHRCMCMDADRQKMEFSVLDKEEAPNEKFIGIMQLYKDWIIPWNVVDHIQNSFKNEDSDNDDLLILIAIITCCRAFAPEDLEYYKYALKNIRKVTDWLGNYMESDFSSGISVVELTVIVQEIINDIKNNFSVNNRFYGYHNAKKLILTVITKNNKADAIAHEALLTRLENRRAVYLGAREMIERKRKIEKVVYKIKEFIFSCRNIDDMELVHNVLFHFASRGIMSKELEIKRGNELMRQVSIRLADKGIIGITFIIKNARVFGLFREYPLREEKCMEEVATTIADRIKECFKTEYDSCVETNIECKTSNPYKNDSERRFLLCTIVDKESKKIIFTDCFEIQSNEICEKIKKLGLGNFLYETPNMA